MRRTTFGAALADYQLFVALSLVPVREPCSALLALKVSSAPPHARTRCVTKLGRGAQMGVAATQFGLSARLSVSSVREAR
jgi:hypothetical protein